MTRARIGRVLITFVALFWAVGAIAADFNDTHVFNPAWLPHARFHSAFQLVVAAGMAAVAVRLVWACEHGYGALLAGIYPGAFFITPLVSGVSFSDPGRPAPEIAGIPGQIVLAIMTLGMLVVGYHLSEAPDGVA